MDDSRFTATKLDTNKPPMDLIPWEAMTGVAQVLDFGRQKYAPHNWRKGFLWGRLASAALRHLFAWLSGEDLDPESGLSHVDHALCCLMFLSAHTKSRLGKDDRACNLLTEGRADRLPAAYVPKNKRVLYDVAYGDAAFSADSSDMKLVGFATKEAAEAAAKARAEVTGLPPHRYTVKPRKADDDA